MTTLTDTLPILDEAVPALPAKVEDVARAGDAFADVARKAIDRIHGFRDEAEGLVSKVTEALEALRDRAHDAAERLETEGRELRNEAEQVADDVDTDRGRIEEAGGQGVAALESLEKQAADGREAVSSAHEETRAATARTSDEAQEGQAKLQEHAGLMAAALSSAVQAASDGQALASEGVTALQEAMARLLLETQARLQQTANTLDELAGEQETAVTAIASQLSDGQQKISQDVAGAIQQAWQKELEPAVEAAASTLQAVGTELLEAETETTARREVLDALVKTAALILPPIAAGLEQAKIAAQKVGLAWE